MTLVDAPCAFEHEALFYDSDAGYVDGLLDYLREGLDLGEAVIVVAPERNAELLRGALGSRAADVTFMDAVDWYRHPIRTIAQYEATLGGLGGARARVVGEVQFGTTPEEWAGWTRYEAALNRALAHHDARVVCPYHLTDLPEAVVAEARRTHPGVLDGGVRAPSAGYVGPEALLADMHFDLAAPGAQPELDLSVSVGGLAACRAAFAAFAVTHVGEARAAELGVAVNEVVTNAITHGGGAARVRAWSTLPGGITCTVDDDGPGSDDPLLGFVPVPEEATSGRGMWLVRQIFDRAEVSRPDHTFRVTMEALAD